MKDFSREISKAMKDIETKIISPSTSRVWSFVKAHKRTILMIVIVYVVLKYVFEEKKEEEEYTDS